METLSKTEMVKYMLVQQYIIPVIEGMGKYIPVQQYIIYLFGWFRWPNDLEPPKMNEILINT